MGDRARYILKAYFNQIIKNFVYEAISKIEEE